MGKVKKIWQSIFGTRTGLPVYDSPPPPIKLYSTIDMPMSVFMNALIDKDFSEVDKFEDVLLAYYECIGGKDVQNAMNENIEYQLHKLRVQSAQNLILLLSIKPTPELFEQLKSLNYHLQLPAPELEDVEKYCAQIEGWVKLDYINLLETENEQKSKKQTIIEYTRDYFMDRIIAVNSALKISISEKDSVRMFCRAMINYKAYVKSLENQNKKQAA